MRPVLSACSRLPFFRLQPQAPSVARDRRLGLLRIRRDIHIRIDRSLQGRFAVKAFHGPDEEEPHLADCHLSFKPGEAFEFGDDESCIERKLRGRIASMLWLATHTGQRTLLRDSHSFVAFEVFDSMFSAKLADDPANNPDLRHVHNLKVRQKEGAPGSQFCDRSIRVLIGPHLCIVKEPCGPTLATLQKTQPNRSFALPVAKRIIKQTLLALDFVHTRMKRTHIGVNAYNIQVALLGSKQQLMTKIQDHLDANPPQMAYRSIWDRLGWWASEGGTTMKAQTLPAFGLSPSLGNLEIRLGRCEYATVDKEMERKSQYEAMVGNAPFGTAYNEMHAPLLLAAPEAIQGSPGPYSPPINIWAVGHLLFQCLTGEIVSTKSVNFMGREFPDPTDFVYLLHNPQVFEERLRSFAHINEEMADKDVQATSALLARCFNPDPAARPTAKQLLADRWFRS